MGYLPGTTGVRYVPSVLGLGPEERIELYSRLRQQTTRGVAPAFGPLLAYVAKVSRPKDRELRQYVSLAAAVENSPPGSHQYYQALYQLASIPPERIHAALRRGGFGRFLDKTLEFWRSRAYADPRWQPWIDVGLAQHARRRLGGALSSYGGYPAAFWRGFGQSVGAGAAAQAAAFTRGLYGARAPKVRGVGDIFERWLYGEIPGTRALLQAYRLL